MNQIKRELEACTDRKEKKKLEKVLLELRVDLNYILVRQLHLCFAGTDANLTDYFSQHYPKLKKYISLFPPEIRQKDGADEKGKSKETEEQAGERVKTDAQREEIRYQIRSQMEKGELSTEPELEERGARKNLDLEDALVGSGTPKKTAKTVGSKRVPKIEEDDFFGEESGDEVESGGDAEDDDTDED